MPHNIYTILCLSTLFFGFILIALSPLLKLMYLYLLFNVYNLREVLGGGQYFLLDIYSDKARTL